MKIKPLEKEGTLQALNLKLKKIIYLQWIIVLILILSFIVLNFAKKEDFTEDSVNVENQLRKILLLPSEKFEIGEITNIEKLVLDLPEVYKDARNGDNIIIFSDRMIIFRSSENKIINYVYLVK